MVATVAGSKGSCLGLQGDVAVQRNKEILIYMSNLQLRDEFLQDEVLLIINESVLKTPAKTQETNVTAGLKTKLQTNLHSKFVFKI